MGTFGSLSSFLTHTTSNKNPFYFFKPPTACSLRVPYEKEKGVRFLSNSLISKALQDGLEPEYMKPTEIIRNYKKLNTNKLHKRIER